MILDFFPVNIFVHRIHLLDSLIEFFYNKFKFNQPSGVEETNLLETAMSFGLNSVRSCFFFANVHAFFVLFRTTAGLFFLST